MMRKYYDLAAPLRIIVGVIFLVIVLLTLAQIFSRYVLDSPLLWSEELVRMLLVWLVFIGSAVVCWDGNHLNVDTFFSKTRGKFRIALRWMNMIIAIIFLAVLAWSSLPLIEIEGMINMGSLPIPLSVIRMPALVGGILMVALIILRRFYRLPCENKLNPDKDQSQEAM